jgi:hypothetical protein
MWCEYDALVFEKSWMYVRFVFKHVQSRPGDTTGP